MHASASPDNPRIIVPIVAGVGNALMAVPVVRQLKRAKPGARITIVARIDAMGEPFQRLAEVDEVLITGNGWRGILRKVWWTRRRKADVYIVPFPSNRWQYNLLALLSGARARVMHRFPIGYWRAMAFVRARRVPAVRGIHDVRQNLRLLEALGIEPQFDEPPRFVVNDNDRARAAVLLQQAGVDEQTAFVALHAGSGQTILGKAKRWPPTKWGEFLARFRREFSHHVVLLEGPDEAGVGDEILRECDDEVTGLSIVRLTGPLGDAAAVLERAQLYMGSDSGLAHLASAVGTKAVTVFAPADPDRVCPFGYRDLVVRVNKDCSPCFHYPWKTPYPKLLCREPYCVSEVEVDDVLDAVRRALAPLRVLVPSPSGRGLG
jgi:ADP-heptose:LPS heptosyltransferase